MARSVEPLAVGRVIGDVLDMFTPTVGFGIRYGTKQVANGCQIKPSPTVDCPRVQIYGSRVSTSLCTLVTISHQPTHSFFFSAVLSLLSLTKLVMNCVPGLGTLVWWPFDWWAISGVIGFGDNFASNDRLILKSCSVSSFYMHATVLFGSSFTCSYNSVVHEITESVPTPWCGLFQ